MPYPNQELREKLRALPKNPGVYFHKNSRKEVIYVGKASNLKNRVSSYFRGEHDVKTEALVREIFTTDWIETDSEIDALFLESEMIKRYMPPFNILLRDDKSATFVRINFHEKLPTVETSRNPADDGAEYIGPFYSAAPLKLSLRYLRKVFPYFARTQDFAYKLNRQIGVVPDVFSRKLDEKTGEFRETLDAEKVTNYKKNLRILVRYLRGERMKIQAELEREMKLFAKKQEFERAAKVRNQLRHLNELKKQIVFGREEFMDASRDFALAELKNLLDLPEIPRRIEAYDISHISGTSVVASMVVATNGVMDRREYRKFKLREQKNDDTASLREVLERRFSPRNASWQKPDLVILDGGKPQISAVREILEAQKIAFIGRDKSGDHSGNAEMKIQVPSENFAKKVDENLEKVEQNFREKSEDISRKNNLNFREIPLEKTSHIAMLIARLDEEAHRFAITYHQNLRAKTSVKSALDDISGVGPATKKKLLREFGSLKKIRENLDDNYDDFAKKVGEKLAKKLREKL